MSFTQKLASRLNVRTVLVLGFTTLMSLLIFAAQYEEYTKAYLLLGITISVFVMYLVTSIPSVAKWIKENVDVSDKPISGD